MDKTIIEEFRYWYEVGQQDPRPFNYDFTYIKESVSRVKGGTMPSDRPSGDRVMETYIHDFGGYSLPVYLLHNGKQFIPGDDGRVVELVSTSIPKQADPRLISYK